MSENGNKAKSNLKSDKLRSALRENLKKRKGQARKLGQVDGEEGEGFSVKLRTRDIPKTPSSDKK